MGFRFGDLRRGFPQVNAAISRRWVSTKTARNAATNRAMAVMPARSLPDTAGLSDDSQFHKP